MPGCDNDEPLPVSVTAWEECVAMTAGLWQVFEKTMNSLQHIFFKLNHITHHFKKKYYVNPQKGKCWSFLLTKQYRDSFASLACVTCIQSIDWKGSLSIGSKLQGATSQQSQIKCQWKDYSTLKRFAVRKVSHGCMRELKEAYSGWQQSCSHKTRDWLCNLNHKQPHTMRNNTERWERGTACFEKEKYTSKMQDRHFQKGTILTDFTEHR